jgi:hypothetical protein
MLIIGRIIDANLVLVFFFCVDIMYAYEYDVCDVVVRIGNSN